MLTKHGAATATLAHDTTKANYPLCVRPDPYHLGMGLTGTERRQNASLRAKSNLVAHRVGWAEAQASQCWCLLAHTSSPPIEVRALQIPAPEDASRVFVHPCWWPSSHWQPGQ